jgi:hypothetical protein
MLQSSVTILFKNPKTSKSIQMINCRDKIYKSLLPHWTGIQGKGSEAVFKENRVV